MGDDTQIVELAKLRGEGPHRFEVVVSDAQRRGLSENLALNDLRKVRATAEFSPIGRRDWRLIVTWGATVVQPCVVSTDPVTTRLDQVDERAYLANYQVPQDEEAEMPEDDTTEALPEFVDLHAVLAEMITLALPEYPRAQNAELDQTVFAEPGVAPMTDEDAKPFAGLAALRDQLSKDAKE